MEHHYTCCSDVPFHNISAFLQQCSTVKPAMKVKALQYFRQCSVPRTADDIFQVYRLLLPKMDAKRGNYGLKEGKLAPLLVDACGLSTKSCQAQQAIGWKKAGVRGAGNFVAVMETYLLRSNCGLQDQEDRSKTLTVGMVNSELDRLAGTDSKEEQVASLRWLLLNTSPTQMKWLLAIILKDVKVGMSDERILRDFHPDAEDLYNVSMDLERVTRELVDPTRRMPRRDVEPLQPIRPQLCSRANSLEDAFRQMKDKAFVSEVKFDGVRMQVHITPQEVRYFSRRGREHGDYYRCTIFDAVLRQQVRHSTCILDGEMVVWNKARCEFMPFGGFRSAMNAAFDNVSADSVVSMVDQGVMNTAKPELMEPPLAKELEVVYICFDLLFMGEESIINRPLQERLQLLRQAVAPAPASGILLAPSEVICGRVVPLLPDECLPGLGPDPYSKVSSSLADLQDMYNRAVARQEEGVVVKALNSPWAINDRSKAWLKVKPDYLEDVEVDCLIIGGYYGTGRNGGQISEYLLALAEEPAVPTAVPNRWVSFCRVGTGMSDEQRERMRQQLAPVLAASAKAPHHYRVTGTTKERPDVWVKDPSRSIVLTVKSDVRMIVSKVYAADYSLRFPRVEAVRWDKDASCVNTDRELREQVEGNQGALVAVKARLTAEVALPAAGAGGGEALGGWRRGRKAARKGGKKEPEGASRGGVVGHLMPADVSGVGVEVNLLQGAEVCILNFAPMGAGPQQLAASKQELSELVKKMGGEITADPRHDHTAYVLTEVMDPRHRKVAPLIAQGEKGQRTFDIISTTWLRECYAAQQLLPILPRHYLYISSPTRYRNAGIDIHGDPYFQQVTADDVKQLLEVLMHEGTWAKAQREWEHAEQRVEAAEAAEGPAPPEPDDAAATTAQVLVSVQAQLQQLPQAAQQQDAEGARRALLLGCTIMLAALFPGPSSNSSAGAGTTAGSGSPASSQQAGEQRMDGEEAALAAAAKWRAVAQQQRLSDLELQVMAHGGQVVTSYSSKVTHVVWYSPDTLPAQVMPSATAPAAAGASMQRLSSAAALQSDAITAETLIASLQQMLRQAATRSTSAQQTLNRGDSDRAAAQAAAVLGSSRAAAPAAAAVQGGAKGPTAMTQLAQQMQGQGAAAAAAQEQAAASIVKQLRPIRRRLATGRLQLVSSAWVTDSLAAAAAAAPTDTPLRRRPERLFTPGVLQQALRSAGQAPEAAAAAAAAAAAGGGSSGGASEAEAGHQQPSAASSGKQQGGVWGWPWEMVGLGDGTAGSSSDSDGAGTARKGQRGRRRSSGLRADTGRAAGRSRSRVRSAKPTAAPSDDGQAHSAGASTGGSREKRATRKRGAAAAAATTAGPGDEEEEVVAPKRRRAAEGGSRRRIADGSPEGAGEGASPVVKLEAAEQPADMTQGPVKRLKQRSEGQGAVAAMQGAGAGDVTMPDAAVDDATQQQQQQQQGRLKHEEQGLQFSSQLMGAAAASVPSSGSGGGRGRKLPRLPPLASSLPAEPAWSSSQPPAPAGTAAAAGGYGSGRAPAPVAEAGGNPCLQPAAAVALAAPSGSGPPTAGGVPVAAPAAAAAGPSRSRLLQGLLAAMGEDAPGGQAAAAAVRSSLQPRTAELGSLPVAPCAEPDAAATLGAASSQRPPAAARAAPPRGRLVANMLAALDGDGSGVAAGAPAMGPLPAAAGGAGSMVTQPAAPAAPVTAAAAEGGGAPDASRKKASIRAKAEALLGRKPQ